MLLSEWLKIKKHNNSQINIWEDYFCDKSELLNRENEIYRFLEKIKNNFILDRYSISLENVQTSYGTYDKIILRTLKPCSKMFQCLLINIKNPILHTEDYELTFNDIETKLYSSNEGDFIKILNSLSDLK